MFPVLVTLSVLDLAFFTWTAMGGLLLEGDESLKHHLTWGVVTAMLFCFTHCLVLFYLIGSEKDVKEALEPHPRLAERYVPWAKSLKRVVFPWASLATLAVIIAALLGAHVHSSLLIEAARRSLPPDQPPPLREVGGWWVHAVAVSAALLLHLIACSKELRVVRENRRGIDEVNAILERQSPAAPLAAEP